MANHHSTRVACECRYCGAAFTLPPCRLKIGMGSVCETCRHPTDAERFWRRVQKSDGCWTWLGSAHRHGHGYATMDGRVTYAHRVAWTLTHGAIPDGLDVCHKCDNPPCVRPDHLFVGTHADNMRDMAVKGRALEASKKRSKLTEHQVRDIKAMLADGMTQREIADRVRIVSRSAIGLIQQGRRWSHIKVEVSE